MLEAGQMLEHFKIERSLGVGGMGAVYLAEDTRLHRKVALKVLLDDYFEDEERKKRFYREARSAAGISNPYVMAIFDIGAASLSNAEGKLDYIIMEYIDGLSLTEYLDSNRSDMKACIRVAEKISIGLAAAHKMNIIHRDIKPANIIIDGEGNPRILDFGLAKSADPYQSASKEDSTDTISQELTQAGKIIGTVSYMSPEQIRGEKLDNRSDIFSFGILLYHMATGELPFAGESRVSTMAKVLESDHESPRARNGSIPIELERIIGKCLHKKPEDRYQDSRDLVVDLRNLRRQHDSGISETISGIQDIHLQMGGKKSQGKMVKIPILVVAALVIILAYFMKDRIFSEKPVEWGNGLAILGFSNNTNDTIYDWLETGLPEILQTNLAQYSNLKIINRNRVVDCISDKGKRHAGFGHDHEACLRAANYIGARHVLTGSLYRIGENQLRLDARLEDLSSGQIVQSARVVGPDPFILVDSLTKSLAAVLSVETISGSESGVASLTSASTEAYKIYHLALIKFEKGLYEDAIAECELAIAADSTFALPYMRIGLAWVFQGRQQAGVEWFAKALKYRDKLPRRDRDLLDIYADLWFEVKYDDAQIKLDVLAENYPDDKEVRTIRAMLINAFRKDTTQTFAELDVALGIDPDYILALNQYATIYGGLKLYDRALEFGRKAQLAHPDSPLPYNILATIYSQMEKFDRAISEYKTLLEKFPGRPDEMFNLSTVYIYVRDFDNARLYLEKINQLQTDDLYGEMNYYTGLANLALWEAKFKTSTDYRLKRLETSLKSGDSARISIAYTSISNHYRNMRMPDSSVYYSRLGHEWANMFQAVNFATTMVENYPDSADVVRKLFQEKLNDIRGRLPSEIWGLADGMNETFEGYAAADTTMLIDGLEKIFQAAPGGNESINRSVAYLCARTGQFQKARDILIQYKDRVSSTAGGVTYMFCLYHLGLANEGLGNKKEAIANYQELLRYWGQPDVELDEIKDSRSRLARLTSQT